MPTPTRIHSHTDADSGDVKIGPTELAILRFLIARAGKAFSRVQISVQTGYRRKSSTFQGAFPKLVKTGWVKQVGSDFMIGGSQNGNFPTDLLDILGHDFEAAPDSPEDWLSKLQPTPRKIFEAILANPDVILSREELAEATGYSKSSSTFQAAFPELEKIGLIKKASGGVQFNAENFT